MQSLSCLTADINADLLMRLRPNRCVFGAPGPYPAIRTRKTWSEDEVI